MNSNNGIGSSSVFNAKGSSTSASSSHWQGAVVTQTTQHQTRSVTKQHYTDDEDGDEDFDSGADDGTDSSDTTSGKTTRKQSTKNNKNNSKNNSKSEFKSTTNSTGGGRRSNKDNKVVSYNFYDWLLPLIFTIRFSLVELRCVCVHVVILSSNKYNCHSITSGSKNNQ